jgi:hypothetical protein
MVNCILEKITGAVMIMAFITLERSGMAKYWRTSD